MKIQVVFNDFHVDFLFSVIVNLHLLSLPRHLLPCVSFNPDDNNRDFRFEEDFLSPSAYLCENQPNRAKSKATMRVFFSDINSMLRVSSSKLFVRSRSSWNWRKENHQNCVFCGYSPSSTFSLKGCWCSGSPGQSQGCGLLARLLLVIAPLEEGWCASPQVSALRDS